MNWSSKSLAGSFRHNFFRFMIRLRILPLARILMHIVVGYYILLPRIRMRIRPYLTHRFPDDSAWKMLLHTWRIYTNFAEIIFERMKLSTGMMCEAGSNPESDAVIREALYGKQGAIVLSAHIGAWQLALRKLESFDRPIRLLQYVDDGDVDRHYFQGNGQHDIKIINSRLGTAGLIDAAIALREGCLVCIMGDRLTDADRLCVEVPFLGGNILVPGMPYVLSSITGCPLLLSLTVLKDGKPYGISTRRIDVPGKVPRTPKELTPYARMFVQSIEDFIDKHPHQFFNFHDMWDNGNSHGPN